MSDACIDKQLYVGQNKGYMTKHRTCVGKVSSGGRSNVTYNSSTWHMQRKSDVIAEKRYKHVRPISNACFSVKLILSTHIRTENMLVTVLTQLHENGWMRLSMTHTIHVIYIYDLT